MQQENNISENFFSRLQKTLIHRGLGLPDLAARTGIALSTMYRWKDSEPQARTVRQIAGALDVPISVLLGGEDNPLREAFANSVREESAAYGFGPRVKLTVEDLVRLLKFDLDTISHTHGEERQRAFLMMREVHLPSLAKLLHVD